MVKSMVFTVSDPVGLYATSATALVNTMKEFSSDITLVYSSKAVNLKSLMGVLSLGIPTKANIEVIAKGTDEEAVIERVSELMIELGISEANNRDSVKIG